MTGVVPSPNMRKSLEESSKLYATQLLDSPGESYLLGRGITKSLQDSFRLGYVEEPLPGDELFKGRISIPYLTAAGVVSIRFRSTVSHEFKYLGRPGDRTRPFNVGVLSDPHQTIYITEGEMDAIIATAVGLPAVGLPGVMSWKSRGKVYARLFRFRRVVVLADGDEPGRKFAELVASALDGCRIIGMPDGEDVNSMFQQLGHQGLREYVGIE